MNEATNQKSISTLPILFPSALFAGVGRLASDFVTFEEMRSGTMFKGRENFDRFRAKSRIATRHVGKSHEL
jgi:hypothetical protein